MLPCLESPRAGQSGLWQNWVCGSIDSPPRTRFGDHVRRDARWARIFQASNPLITVPWGATLTVLTVESLLSSTPTCCTAASDRDREVRGGPRGARAARASLFRPFPLGAPGSGSDRQIRQP